MNTAKGWLEIVPCLCGSTDTESMKDHGFFVRCNTCGRMGIKSAMRELSIRAWNKKVEMEAKADKLREATEYLADAAENLIDWLDELAPQWRDETLKPKEGEGWDQVNTAWVRLVTANTLRRSLKDD